MHLAAGIKIIASRVSDDVDFLMPRNLGAHKRLPVHQFVAKLADIRPGHQNMARKKTEPRIGQRAGDLFSQRKLMGRQAAGFADIKVGWVSHASHRLGGTGSRVKFENHFLLVRPGFERTKFWLPSANFSKLSLSPTKRQ